jgi:hypothetical protein
LKRKERIRNYRHQVSTASVPADSAQRRLPKVVERKIPTPAPVIVYA